MELAKQQPDDSFAEVFAALRESSTVLCATLTPEDCNLQAMPETSPAKWHLAHTTWFFETFVLGEYCVDYLPVNPLYAVLFNSYYNGIGEQFPRAQRALQQSVVARRARMPRMPARRSLPATAAYI
jgi:hypothetical protein